METFVLILNATNFTHIDNELLNFVSYERQSTIEKYLFDKDKRLSLYSSLLTKMQLSKLLNCAPNKLNFGFTALNKPCLLNKPEIFFNYSHSDYGILLGISKENEIGVDMQLCDNAIFSIMDIAFHPAEIDYILSSNNTTTQSDRFFEIWTKKEAYTKSIGKGLTCGLTKINSLSYPIAIPMHTWKIQNYRCSSYTPKIESHTNTILSEHDIIDFFLH